MNTKIAEIRMIINENSIPYLVVLSVKISLKKSFINGNIVYID